MFCCVAEEALPFLEFKMMGMGVIVGKTETVVLPPPGHAPPPALIAPSGASASPSLLGTGAVVVGISVGSVGAGALAESTASRWSSNRQRGGRPSPPSLDDAAQANGMSIATKAQTATNAYLEERVDARLLRVDCYSPKFWILELIPELPATANEGCFLDVECTTTRGTPLPHQRVQVDLSINARKSGLKPAVTCREPYSA